MLNLNLSCRCFLLLLYFTMVRNSQDLSPVQIELYINYSQCQIYGQLPAGNHDEHFEI